MVSSEYLPMAKESKLKRIESELEDFHANYEDYDAHKVAGIIYEIASESMANGIERMYEALKIAEARIYNEIRYHPEAGDYRKMLQDELRQISKALAKAEGK